MTDTEKIQLAEDLYNDPSTTQKEKALLEKLFPEIKPVYFLEIPAGDVAPAEEDGPLEEDIFPESSESEEQPMDEKIRQYLIQMVNAIRADDFELSGLNKEEVLEYLEKQKEQPAESEKLKAEIEKRLKNIRNYIKGAGMKYKGPKFYKAQGKESAYDALLSIIDSLQQEQPEVDLKEEAYMCGFAQGAKEERERILADIIKMRDTAENRELNFGAVCGFQIALDELEQMLTGKLARKEE